MEPVSWRPAFAPPATPLTRRLLVYFRSGAYMFPVSAEITRKDRRIEFNALIGRLAVTQSFNVEEMQFQGSLEL